MFNDFGFNWPELDIIKKSIGHDLYGNEQIDEADTEWDPIVKSKLTEYILDQIIKHMNLGDYTYAIYNLRACAFDDINKWPKLKECFEKNKHGIIKYLLSELTNEDSEPHINCHFVSKIIHNLMRMGLRWEELYTIDKSASHEISKYKNAQYANDRLDENIYKSKTSESLFDRLMYALKRNEGEESICAFYTIAQYENFKLWPNDAKKVEPYKTFIMRSLLIVLRDGELINTRLMEPFEPRDILMITKGMRKLGINWSELNAIEKSARAELDTNNSRGSVEVPNAN
jgi:hypothetical protein